MTEESHLNIPQFYILKKVSILKPPILKGKISLASKWLRHAKNATT